MNKKRISTYVVETNKGLSSFQENLDDICDEIQGEDFGFAKIIDIKYSMQFEGGYCLRSALIIYESEDDEQDQNEK